MGVEENVSIGKAVKAALELCVELGHGLPPDAVTQSRFYRAIRNELIERYPLDKEASRQETLTDVESRRFGLQPMQGRKHEGDQIDDVPLDYLHWFAETSDFVKELRRYLKSPRVVDRGRREE